MNEIHLKLALDPYSGVNTTLFGEQKTHVQADGQTVATQRKASQEYDSMTWEHFDPSGASYAVSAIVEGNFYGTRTAELDATGSNAGMAAPEPYDPWNPWMFPGFGSISDDRCTVDGIRGVYSLHQCFGMLANGSADIDFSRMDAFTIGQWGIMPSWTPYSGGTYTPPAVPDGTIDGGTTSTQGHGSWSYLLIGSIGFQTQTWIDRQKILDDTRKRIEQRFKDHPDCLKLFNNMDPVKHMQGITISRTPQDDGKFPQGESQAAVTDSPPLVNGVRPCHRTDNCERQRIFLFG